MSKPTIASLQAELLVAHEQIAQLRTLNEAQQAKFDVLHAWAEQASAELKALRAKQPAAKPQAPKAPARPAHKPGEFIEPARFRSIKGVEHRAYYGRGAGVIGWKPV